MPKIMDYLDWRGDIPFSFQPVNDVDSYVISKIGSIDWTDIVPADGGYIPLHQAVQTYIEIGGTKYLGLIASPHVVPAVLQLPQTERFGCLELTMFRKTISLETTEQFSALTVRLPDGRHYITFRGTDDTLIGWKEDCLFAVEKETPAQKSAVAYLQEVAEKTEGKLIVSGHSKGGNLAVYASSSVSEELQQRIEKIWNFDGPGFEEQFFEKPGYLAVKDKIRKIYSKNAMVGTMLQQRESAHIVDCNSFGVTAHDGFTWEVNAHSFVPYPELTPAAKAFNETMDKLLENRTQEEKRELIQALFDALSASGADTLTGLTEQGIRKTVGVAHTLYKDPSVHQMVTELLETMAKEYVKEKRKALRGIRTDPQKNEVGRL